MHQPHQEKAKSRSMVNGSGPDQFNKKFAATKEGFYKLYSQVVEGKDRNYVIPPELIFGADETGIQEVTGQKEKVFRKKGKKTMHQERTGTRENITVLVTICVDGEALRPAVIYKGKRLMTG